MADKIIYRRDDKRLANMDLKRIDPPKPGEHLEIRDTACDGLRLRVTSKGHKSWCVVYRVSGAGSVGKRGRPGKGRTRRYTLEEPFRSYRESQEAVQDLFNQGSEVAAFVHDCCEEGPGREVEKDRLYAVYRAWCDRTGRKPKNDAAFATDLYAATSNRVTPRRPSRGGERVNVYAV